MKKSVALGALAGLAMTGSAMAQSWAEVGDAGDMPGTAQAVSGGGALTSITGSIGALTDADMFLIDIKVPTLFSATTNPAGGTLTDSTLYLFNLNGTGIAKHDDISGSNYLSDLPAGNSLYSSLAPGQYLLAIGGFAFAPYWNPVPATFADLVFDVNNFTGVIGPQNPGPILGWANAGAYDSGSYTITLTGASFVPAPGSIALLGLGGLVAARRRRA